MDTKTKLPGRRSWGMRFLCRSVVDLARGMQRLHAPSGCVTVFGSARLGEHEPAYHLARDLGRSLGEAGFTVMTGGGPGLMEAANRGARDSGAQSLGCRLVFSFEQASNHHMDRVATVRYFFVRKIIMCRQATGFVVLPGGIGTLDELFEILALIQTKRMRPKPIILLGKSYWYPLLTLLDQMVATGTVARADISLIEVTDDIDHAVNLLARSITTPALRSSGHERVAVQPEASNDHL